MKDEDAICIAWDVDSRHNSKQWVNYEYIVTGKKQTFWADSVYKLSSSLTNFAQTRPGYVFVTSTDKIAPKDLFYEPLNYVANATIKSVYYTPL